MFFLDKDEIIRESMVGKTSPTPSATSPVTGVSSTPANTGSVSGVSNSKGFGNSPSPSSHPYKGFSPSINRAPRSGSPSTFGTQSTPTMPAKYNEEGRLIPIVQEAVNKYMDIYDRKTLNAVFALDEAEQNSLLVSLTNRLYSLIVKKVDEVDFGEIPKTQGDIKRLSKYGDMMECIEVLKGIFEQYREPIGPVMEIQNAINNIDNLGDLFRQCFLGKVELGIVMYNTMTLSCINALSYMIAVCIEYVKTPNTDGLSVVMDKTGVTKVKDHLLYENLVKFNESVRKGEVEDALRPLIKSKARGFFSVALGIKAAFVIGGVLIALLPIIRDLVYFFFAAKERVSTYFDIQADLLEMNANELKDNPSIKTEDDRKSVIRKQLAIAASFRKLSNALAVKAKQAENKADRDIKTDDRKARIDDVETSPAETDGGPLF